MKLMIGVPTGEYGRKVEFFDCLDALEKPDQTLLTRSHGQSPAKNRNVIIQSALDHDCTHILFIDDDMVFEKDVLTKLMVHADKDVVSGLYLMRNYPHYPLAFDEAYGDGKCKFMFLTPDKSGLQEVVNCGFGFVLMRTSIFKVLEKPWIRLGEIVKDEWCDDVGFFNRVRKAGFRIYCDLDVRLGHTINVSLWPRKDGGNWTSTYVTQTGQMFQFPQVQTISGAENPGQ